MDENGGDAANYRGMANGISARLVGLLLADY